MNLAHNHEIQRQFDLRAPLFDQSVHWITDRNLIAAHVRAAGETPGVGLEMCCGTGAVARGMQESGWRMTGLDISPGMVAQARRHIEAVVGDVADPPFPSNIFDAIVLRQAYFLLADGPKMLAAAHRLLKPGGRLVVSLTVPFDESDSAWLRHVHTVKQAQMVRFFTANSLGRELADNGFPNQTREELTVRESVSKWMRFAPELSETTRERVCNLILNGPSGYRQRRRIGIENGEILEDWNWVIYSAVR